LATIAGPHATPDLARGGPDAQPVKRPEVSVTTVDANGSKRLVGGKPWTYVDRVSQPTMTVYSPAGRNTGAASWCFPAEGTTYWRSTRRHGSLRLAHVQRPHVRAAQVPGAMRDIRLRPTSFPITRWPRLVEEWLATIGMIEK
jgi:hypothetical protein